VGVAPRDTSVEPTGGCPTANGRYTAVTGLTYFDRVADLEDVVELDGVVVAEPHAALRRAAEVALVERDAALGEEDRERHRGAVVLRTAVVRVLPLDAEVARGRLVAGAAGADRHRAVHDRAVVDEPRALAAELDARAGVLAAGGALDAAVVGLRGADGPQPAENHQRGRHHQRTRAQACRPAVLAHRILPNPGMRAVRDDLDTLSTRLAQRSASVPVTSPPRAAAHGRVKPYDRAVPTAGTGASSRAPAASPSADAARSRPQPGVDSMLDPQGRGSSGSTSTRPAAAIVLAAGEGTRMRSAVPKVLHPIAGRSLLGHAVHAVAALEPEHLVVVVGAGADQVRAAIDGIAAELARPVLVAHQHERRGTGHAVRCALDALPDDLSGPVVVTYGDTPLLQPPTLAALVADHTASGAPLTLLTSEVDDPTGYGWVLRESDGTVTRIVEEVDATPEQRALREVSSAVYASDAAFPSGAIDHLRSHNNQGELYLTDLVKIAHGDDLDVRGVRCDDDWQVRGVNDRVQLAAMRA